MTNEDCPVCEQSDAVMGVAPQGRDAVKFWCQRACGIVEMDGWFLTHDWPNVPLEDKAAIATYLKNRIKPKDSKSPIISNETYLAYVREGKRQRRSL